MKTQARMALACIALIVSPMVHAASYVPEDGLQGYWSFDSNAQDQSGNGNHGTVTNSVWLASGRYGNGYYFQNAGNTTSRNDYINLGSGAGNQLAAINGAISISLWFRSGSHSPASMLVSRHNGGTNGDFLFILNGNGQVVFNIADNSGYHHNAWDVHRTPQGYYDNQWHHALAVFNPDIDRIQIYIDGQRKVNNYIDKNYMRTSVSTVLIGEEMNSLADYEGYMDEVAIWDRALTQEEITRIYNNDPPLPPAPPAPAVPAPLAVMAGVIGMTGIIGRGRVGRPSHR